MAKILVISSKAHFEITGKRLAVIQTELQRRAVKYDLVQVPHTSDILSALAIIFESEDYDAIITCGAIIGHTPQHSILYHECLRGIYDLIMDFAIPLGMALTLEQDTSSALQHAETSGLEAVTSCIALLELQKDLQLSDDEYSFKYQN